MEQQYQTKTAQELSEKWLESWQLWVAQYIKDMPIAIQLMARPMIGMVDAGGGLLERLDNDAELRQGIRAFLAQLLEIFSET